MSTVRSSFDEKYASDYKADGFEASKLSADKVATRGVGGNQLQDGDVIELPNTDSPVIYTRKIDGSNIAASCFLAEKNGQKFYFFFSTLGRRVMEYNPDDKTPLLDDKKDYVYRESSSKVAEDYKKAANLQAFLSAYKGKKIEVTGHDRVFTVYNPRGLNGADPRPVNQAIYDFEAVATKK